MIPRALQTSSNIVFVYGYNYFYLKYFFYEFYVKNNNQLNKIDFD